MFDHFKAGSNALTVQDSGATHIEDRIRLRDTRPFRTQPRGVVVTKKSVFNRMVGEAGAGGLELASKQLDRKAETVNTAGHEDHLRPARSAAAQGQGCRR